MLVLVLIIDFPISDFVVHPGRGSISLMGSRAINF